MIFGFSICRATMSRPGLPLTRLVTHLRFGHLTGNASFGLRTGRVIGVFLKKPRAAAEAKRQYLFRQKKSYRTIGPAMDNSLFMNRSAQKQNGTCGYSAW